MMWSCFWVLFLQIIYPLFKLDPFELVKFSWQAGNPCKVKFPEVSGALKYKYLWPVPFKCSSCSIVLNCEEWRTMRDLYRVYLPHYAPLLDRYLKALGLSKESSEYQNMSLPMTCSRWEDIRSLVLCRLKGRGWALQVMWKNWIPSWSYLCDLGCSLVLQKKQIWEGQNYKLMTLGIFCFCPFVVSFGWIRTKHSLKR